MYGFVTYIFKIYFTIKKKNIYMYIHSKVVTMVIHCLQIELITIILSSTTRNTT